MIPNGIFIFNGKLLEIEHSNYEFVKLLGIKENKLSDNEEILKGYKLYTKIQSLEQSPKGPNGQREERKFSFGEKSPTKLLK